MLENILNNLKSEIEYECYEINGKVYTNTELYRFVCNIYHYLIKNNPNKENVIVFGHKDIYMIASFLACSFAGITYIPVDESFPEERKQNIIKQVNSIFIIDKNIEKIMYTQDFKDIDKIYLKENDTYYMIFTSGSTGEPKGVKISYENLKSCVNWLQEISGAKNDVILNQANFSFDLSVADIYLSLISKSKHHILTKNLQSDFPKLFENIFSSKATILVCTPSFADFLLIDKSFNEKNIKNLRQILFCGEKLLSNTVKKIKERFKNIKIINSYGPTECTFAISSCVIENEEDISVGYVKPDSKVYIVNENLNKLNDGEIGEILITGKSVGQGYLKDISNSGYIFFEGNNAYLTGDLGYIKNEKIYCMGRKDSQIKLNGYRIELLEIENVLNKFEYIEKAVVGTKKKDGIIKKIIAFVKLKDISKESNIKIDLEKFLPKYMIPTIKIINEIPMNNNGKCDIDKLLEEY